MGRIKVEEKAKQIVDKLADIRLKQSLLEDEEAEIRAELEMMFDKYYKNQKMIFSSKNKATLIKRLKIKYDAELLEKFLKSISDRDENLVKDCIVTKIIVNDWANLVKFLKKYGVDPKEFKKYLIVEKTAVNSKVKEYFDEETISYEEIKSSILETKISKTIKIT